MVNPLPKILKSTAIVRFQDCDPFGHLNNARYIDYFINARTDQLAHYYDFRLMEFGKTPAQNWVVSKTQIVYLAPAQMVETVTLNTRLIHVTERNLLVEGLMLDEGEKQLKAMCWMEFTYVNLSTGKVASHSPELMTFFNAVRAETLENLHFEGRVKEIRAAYRSMVATKG